LDEAMLGNRSWQKLVLGAFALVIVVLHSSALVAQTWAKDYSIGSQGGAQGLALTLDGGGIAGGWTGTLLNTDVRLLRVDPAGEPVWDFVLVGSDRDEIVHLTSANDGRFVATGHSTSFGAWGHAPLFLRFDGSGTVDTARGFLATGREWGIWIEETSDQGFLIAGAVALGGDNIHATLLRLDKDGHLLSDKTYGPGNFLCVRSTPDHGAIALGLTTTAQGDELLLVKVDQFGEVE
jgi:hypothetical protein